MDREAFNRGSLLRGRAKEVWTIPHWRPLAELDAQRPQFTDLSFKHPDFLAVSVPMVRRSSRSLTRPMWDKYQLTKLAGEDFETNTLIIEHKAADADPQTMRTPRRPGSADSSIVSQRTVQFETRRRERLAGFDVADNAF